MTPLQRITERLLRLDTATSKAIGEVCAANTADMCIGEGCPLWSDDEGLRRRTYFREVDAFEAVTGRRPGVGEPDSPEPRGYCGALHHGD